jgi:integrase
MGRKRIKEGLPNNLYESKNYYNYKHPITKRWFYIGSDRETAIKEAEQINWSLMPKSELVKKVLDSEQSKNFSEFIDYFITDILPAKNLAKKTVQDYTQKIPHIKEHLGNKSIEKIDTKDISEFLKKYPPTQSNYYRAVLSVIFKHAIDEGFTDKNPAASTLKKTTTKQRERLTLENYHAIHAHAPNWLKNAMDLALITAQRREDIANLKWTDIHDGFLWIQQHKTKNRIKINLSEDIKALLIKCKGENEFVIGEIKGNAERITKGFAEAREKSGLETTATFHEIRSLSAHLYEESGIDKKQIQMLLGHTTEKMTEHYLEGHGEKWTEITATDRILRKY